jgi:hypothetical protein
VNVLDKSDTSRIPSALIDIVEAGTPRRDADHGCLLGRDLLIDADQLSRYCLRDLDPVIDDMVLLAGAVAFSDRVVARKTSVAWRRNLQVVIPVHDPDFWGEPKLLRCVTSTLDALTGDNWTLLFKARKRRTQVKPQSVLPLGVLPSLVMPYSDGLDSFAAARLVSAENPGVSLVLVTTGKRRTPALDTSNLELQRQMYRVAIPFRLSRRNGGVRYCEPSYRSRAFVFGVMAGIAAHLLEVPKVFISESGQGALGPWLLPVGNEAPDLRMHPLFTSQFAAMLKLILGREIAHVHPQLWKTKGQTLSELRELGADDGWWLTSSCARDPRHVALGNRRIQCGICAGCLLRRQSLHSAALENDGERYLWSDLSAPSLKQAVNGCKRASSKNDEQQALCAVLEMQHFAEAALAEELIRVRALELCAAVGEPHAEVHKKLNLLVGTHAAEWKQYVTQLGARSFIKTWLESRP